MRIVVFGRTGQVATEIARRAPADLTLTLMDRAAADLSDPEAVADIVRTVPADAMINAAAYTAVDRAELEEDLATRINGAAPGVMARACAARGIPFVHISTDYVFDGSGQAPWGPEAPTAPLGAYGRSKLAGEAAVAAAQGCHAILRTSWVFSAHGTNFVKTMLRLAKTRNRLAVVADQVGGPTPAAAIADAVLRLVRGLGQGGPSGLYHFAGAPDVSWADFAREIFTQAGRAVEVVGIPTKDYPTPAARPLNSRLDCTGLERDHGISRPDWRAGLADILKEIES